MDLIYADTNKRELGTIDDYEMDFAFGSDENSFDLKIGLNAHCVKAGYFLYLDETEYGGIVDTISPDTEAQTVTYSGRTWHGVLEGKVIQPPQGYDYFVVGGEANEVIQSVINNLGLTDLFEASTKVSSITIDYYQFRYEQGYTGLQAMLFAYGGKLNVKHNGKKVILSAECFYNYSDSDEWDNSTIEFSIKKNYRPTNHLICLGSGNLRERHVVHLFTDENGGVQTYKTVDVPYKDSHYILTEQNKVLKGTDEVVELYDYANAEDTYNYVLLTAQPANWGSVYTNYYVMENNAFTQLTREFADEYTLTTSQPADWTYNYGTYYKYEGGAYTNVEGTDDVEYVKLTSMPIDWQSNYSNYYYKYNDGTMPKDEYRGVQGETKYKYHMQTQCPTDWYEKYSSYYYRKKNYAYLYKVTRYQGDYAIVTEESYTEKQTSVKGKVKYELKKKYITSKTYESVKAGKDKLGEDSPPLWDLNKYYTQESYEVAPEYFGIYYYAVPVVTAPTWQTGKYYSCANNEQIPAFNSHSYYELFVDHYAKLIEGGLDRLSDAWQKDKLETKLDAEREYDINDVVGATELVTGISIFQKITKKIVTVKNKLIEIEYKIGG